MKHQNLYNEIDPHYPRTTWKDVLALAVGSLMVTALLLAVVVVGH